MFKFAPILVKNLRKSVPRQQGSALIIALIFLLIMTLLGISTMQGTSQQEIMARNVRDRNLAFQAAEAVSNFCLRQIEPPAVLPPANAIPVQNPGNNPGVFWRNYFANPASARTATYNGLPQVNQLNQPPSCTIEVTNFDPFNPGAGNPCADPQLNCFRVIGHGVGGTANAVAIVEVRCYRRAPCSAPNLCSSCQSRAL